MESSSIHLDKGLRQCRIRSEFSADSDPGIVSVACIDGHLDFPQNRRMMRIKIAFNLLVLAVNSPYTVSGHLYRC